MNRLTASGASYKRTADEELALNNNTQTSRKQARKDSQDINKPSTRPEQSMKASRLQFPIHPLSKYRKACPRFQEPSEILSFSYDKNRKFQPDNRELKYFYPPSLQPKPCLFNGFEDQIKRDYKLNEHIDGLLSALTHLKRNKSSTHNEDADFVMYRGMLTKIFITPYSFRDSWSMNATRIGNTIYVEEDITDEKIADRTGSSVEHQKFMYSGYKFENLCVLNNPADQLSKEALDAELDDRLHTTVDTNSEYCSVFRTQIGNTRIISGAEIDCIDAAKPKSHPNRLYRELKTSKSMTSNKDIWSFERYKLLKFWAQSFIAGIPNVTIGFRNSDGVLQNVENIKTFDIPRRVKEKRGMWEPNVCMNFADCLLLWIKDLVIKQGPASQYRIYYDSEIQSVSVSFIGERTPFLTSEYLDTFKIN